MDALRSARWRSAVIVSAILAASFAGLLAAAPRAGAVTYASGWITTNTVWGSAETTYVLMGNVTVRPGVNLTILPGTTVLADPAVRLYVEGQLLANGTSSSLIAFRENRSGVLWGGVQFNGTSTGSWLQYASLRMADTAVRADRSSPWIYHDAIDQARVGVQLVQSSAWVAWSTISRTRAAVRSDGAGSPVIVANTITSVQDNPAFAIYATGADSITIQSNTIRWVNGTDGTSPVLMGARGGDGGVAAGIVVDLSAWANLAGNTVDRIVGGRGGAGQGSTVGNGGAGGAGGFAAGQVIANTPYSRMQNGRVTALLGGHGGDGGGSSFAGGNGGAGGAGGDAIAYESSISSTTGWWFYNSAVGVTGGSAGNGGPSFGGLVGSGGRGGNAQGFLVTRAPDGNASNNNVQDVRGGSGGNSSNLANGLAGGNGGEASGIWFLGTDGTTLATYNTISSLTGGAGGAGRTAAGGGGNATGLLLYGDGIPFNLSRVTGNQVSSLTGGTGGLGTIGGGPGGSAVGLAAFHVELTSVSNSFLALTGGTGGSPSLNTWPAGRGGDASGALFALVPQAKSSGDRFQSATGGARGSTGTAPPPSRGIGLYAVGSGSPPDRADLFNATFLSNGDFDLFLDNDTETRVVNTTFSPVKLNVAPTANLSVANFLRVDVLWPNNVTLVAGASILVRDEGSPVYNVAAPTGSARWLVVTDRMYINSNTPRDNRTEVDVSHLGHNFLADPRMVDMAVSHTERFTMIDTDPPTSAASALPRYETQRAFSVSYTASDGSGLGLSTITLYSRSGGGWTPFATQAAGTSGSFAFTAPGDGVVEFATVAEDAAGNRQAGPSANNTWTTVDTALPGSHADPLPAYETSRAFSVSWAPDPGVTDIAQYSIEVNAGSGWTLWTTATAAGSLLFNAPSDGTYAFRSIARDAANNLEPAPATNDTWTIVDTSAPFSRTLPLPVYETSTSFLVQWAPEPPDVQSYRIQVRDSGGLWTDWVTATNTSWTFSGALGGHTYEFRSIATDRAGNVQPTPAGNQSWTIVDVTPPDSVVAPLPRYETAVSFGVSWGPVAGVADIATYTVEVSDGGGPWTPVPGAIGTASTSASFSGADGHRYAFRSLARDRAGNVEAAPAGNDTWTIVDATHPTVITGTPRGTGTNLTPSVRITFSEPMDRASAEAAYSIAPDMNGAFSWSPDFTVLTFVPDRPLQAGTSYVVTVNGTARDLAGNTAGAPYTFQFTTTASGTGPAGGLGDYVWVIAVVIAAAVAGVALLLLRRRAGAPAQAPAPAAAKPQEGLSVIDDVFLLYNDGILIKHETRRLKPDIDTDILSGMLTAVQQFVKDSFRSEEGELDEMTFGQMHILIGRGKWVILAAMVSGDGTESFTEQIKRCIEDIESHQWDNLESWKGDMAIAKVLTPYVKKLIRGDYVA